MHGDPADKIYVTPFVDTGKFGSTEDSKYDIEGLVPSEETAKHLAYLSGTPCSWSTMVSKERVTAITSATAPVPRFVIDVLVRNATVKTHFACTVPRASHAYHSLFCTTLSDGHERTRVRLQTNVGGKKQSQADKIEIEVPLSVCALDCEMCQTERGLALTRPTVISESQSVVLDALVVPPEEITDYITQYSGVTPELLRIASRENGIAVNRDGTMVLSMRQAQIAFLRLVSRETVIVGHSLDSDLTALQIVHERVVDTAYLYPHPRGFPCEKASLIS